MPILLVLHLLKLTDPLILAPMLLACRWLYGLTRKLTNFVCNLVSKDNGLFNDLSLTRN